MKKSKYTDSQIMVNLNQAEAERLLQRFAVSMG